MANLKAGTLIGGNLIWNAGNMPLRLSSRNLFINDDEIYTTYKKPTPADVGAVNKAGDTMTGVLSVQAEIKSKSSNSYRMSDGIIGTFWRKDGDNLYLMRTEENQAESGSWSAHRPFAMNLKTAKVTIGNGMLVNGGLEVGEYLTVNNKFVKGANDGIIIRDHGNGNVTLSAGVNSSGAAGDLYLGYTAGASGTAGYNTRSVRLEAGMNWKGGVVIVDSTGKINSENLTGPIRTEKDSSNVYHTIVGGADTVNRGRTIIAAGEAGKQLADNTSSGQEVVHIGGDDNAAIWLHTGLQNGWDGSTHKKVKIDQGELYAVDGTFRVFHHGYKPFRVYSIDKPSGVVDGRYYPILITNANHNQLLYISTRESGGSDPMNNCSFDGIVRSGGWSDRASYAEGLFTAYTATERAIHSIVGPSEATGGYVIYVEARAFPLTLRVDASCSVAVHTADVSFGTTTFKAGLTSAQITSGDYGTKIRTLRDFAYGTGYYRYDGKVNDRSQHLTGEINFDNYVVGGTYNIYNPASTSTNPPPFAYGTLLVIGRGGSEVAHGFVTQYATDKSTRKTYIRTRNDTNWVWSSWVQIYDSGNKPTPADLGAVNKAGDTMTGTLTVPSIIDNSTNIGKTATTYEKITSWAFTVGTSKMVQPASTGNPNNRGGYWQILGRRDSSSGYAGIWVDYANDGDGVYIGKNETGSNNPIWQRVYTDAFKPTANDVGALPITGGRLTGILYAKTGILSESPDGKNWVGLEAADGSAAPYISSKINGTAKKEFEFTSGGINVLNHLINTSGSFQYRRNGAGGYYLNSTKDLSKNKWSFGIQTDNTGLIGKWKEDGTWDRSILEFHPTDAAITANGSLTVKSNVFNLGYSDNANQHVWFRRANGTERSLMWSDEDYLRIRHKEGSWFGIKQNGSVHAVAAPPSMNEGVYNGTTVGGVWRRGQGVYHAKVAHQGSSWAPAFSMYFHDTEGYDGYYTFGHLSSAGAGVGHYCLHFMDGAGNANKAWTFNGSNGDFVSPGNVVAFSDSQVKTNVKPITDALDKIGQITGVTYDRTDIKTDRQMGVIAQEVQKVCPEVVHKVNRGAAGDILGVSYGNLVGLLIEGIKELRSELDELRAQVNK